MKDKTLSDKIVDLSGYTKGSVKSKYYWEKDVKDFIQKLKKDCCECHMHPIMMERDKSWKCWFCVILNKLAGDALIHSPLNSGKSLEDTPEETRLSHNSQYESSGTHGSGNASCANPLMNIETVLGLTLEDIEWMKKYFIENLIEINPKTTDNQDASCANCGYTKKEHDEFEFLGVHWNLVSPPCKKFITDNQGCAKSKGCGKKFYHNIHKEYFRCGKGYLCPGCDKTDCANPIGEKIKKFLSLGVTCSNEAQEFLEDWLGGLRK